MKNTLTSVVAALFFVLVVDGCVHQNTVQPLSALQRVNDPQSFLESMRASGARLKSLRASGFVEIKKGGKHIKAHMLAVAERPAWLRFETESFFDQPLSILTTDGMSFTLWDMDKGRFLVGQATPANISRVIPIPLDGPEVAGILLGDPPLIPYAKLDLYRDKTNQLYRLILSNSRQQQEVRITEAGLRPLEVICYEAGKLWYQLTFDDWSEASNSAQAPQSIRFRSSRDDVEILIHLRKAEINPPLDASLFHLTPPAGINIESID